uniref:Disease resistance protein n=1 Tax=Solanum tuberosum TaxID=4113 RepID=M1CEL4_SOLTU
MSKATKNVGGTPIVGVEAPRVDSGQKLMDSRQKIMDTSDVEDAENSGQHVLQVENENPTKNWTLVAHKRSTSSRSLSPTSQNNSSCSEKVRLTENDHDLIQEKQVSPPALNSKLSPEALVFVPKCVLARKNESSALMSNTIDLGEDSLDEDGVDLGEDSLNEDEKNNMLDICFDRVAREWDISPRQQRSGSNKSKKKTYGRQHSWDSKMTEEFVPRHLPMRQAKQNHLIVSIGSTRSNKSIKKRGEHGFTAPPLDTPLPAFIARRIKDSRPLRPTIGITAEMMTFGIKNGSRIILTTRLSEVAQYAKCESNPHDLPLLRDDESWKLLQKKVFHGDNCPSELGDVGFRIAKSCGGLPLFIVLVAGVLKEKNNKADLWKEVEESLDALNIDSLEESMSIIGFSYMNLPHHLKPCFLYFGGFLRGKSIHVSKLTRLWLAEGFVLENKEKGLEDVAQDFLKNLISRNLVMDMEKRFNGKLKMCRVHDLLHKFCLEKAKQENFLLWIYSLNFAQWSISEDSFPSLERLVLTNCKRLEKIPSHFEDVVSLKSIEVNWCSWSVANSAEEIQTTQREDMANDEFTVTIQPPDWDRISSP